MRMALQLGLSSDPALRLNINDSGRNLLRVTWSSVVQLNLLASGCKSRQYLWSMLLLIFVVVGA